MICLSCYHFATQLGSTHENRAVRDWTNPTRLPMYFSPRYGAKTRSGSPCQSPAMPNGRCRMHGDLPSPGAPKGNKVFGPRHGRRCGAGCPVLVAKRTLAKVPTLSVLLACRRRGSALKYDFAANYRYVGLDVLDLILRHGQVIRRENHQVGQLSWLNRTLPPFFERVTCSRTRIEAQSLLAADGFGCAVNVAIWVLPRHHDVHVEERVDGIDRKIGPSPETVDDHPLDQGPSGHGNGPQSLARGSALRSRPCPTHNFGARVGLLLIL